MSDDLIDMVKECLTEHSKNMVSQSQCNSKLWSILKWAFPISISLIGGVIGLLITLKVDINTVQIGIKDLDKRVSTIEYSYPSIDRKLDILLGDVKPTQTYVDSIRARARRSK